MGNKELRQLHFNPSDPDLIQFRRLYQRYTRERPPQTHTSCTQELLEYQITIHNEAFCEVLERNHHINLKKTQIKVDIDLARFSGNLRLLNYKTNLNGKVSNSRFMRLKDFIELVTDTQKVRILDVGDPSFKFTRKLNPEDKLLIEYHYIMKLSLVQNNLRILPLTLNPDCPYKINIITSGTYFALSPTHKIIQNNNTIQCNFTKGTDSSLFILLFSIKSELQCTKIQFGAEGYSSNHKYCLYLQLPLPSVLYDEMFYLNCDDPKKKDAEQETMETIPWSSISTIQTISQIQWPYFYEVQQFSTKRHITFFLDQSNSMEGTKMQLAKRGLRLFIRSLTPESYFNVYGFGSKWKKMFQTPQKISEPVLQQFEKEVKLLEGNMGSTFLLSALNDALQQSPKSSDTVWFILTDGRIAEIEEIFQLILQNPHIRVFALGFGLEFDHATVEQLANISNGGYSFCSNIQALNTSMIQLLQQALQPQFKMKGKFDNLFITSMYPSSSKPSREIICFLDSFQLQSNPKIEFEITFGVENEPEITQTYSCYLKEVKNNHYLHLYGYIQMFDKILSEISFSDTISSLLSKQDVNDFDINNPLLLLFFNPLNILMIDNHAILCNINLEALQKLIIEQKKQRDIFGLVLQYLSDQTYEQAIRGVMANENIQEQSVSLEMGSSFTQANQEYLMKVIQSQQIDGSFIDTEAIKLVCPTRNPLDSLLQRVPDQNTNQEVINGRQTQQLPSFIMAQIWSTALVIAYLKMNYNQQRGQWVIIFQKALNFIKLYVKNWQPLLYKARQELINIEFR